MASPMLTIGGGTIEALSYVAHQNWPGEASGLDLRGRGPGPRPPTNRGPPIRPVIFYSSFMLVVYKTD